ncbi:MAG: FtsX-like permease family protein [Promethearchaeota archaeon]
MSYITKITQNAILIGYMNDYGADLHVSLDSGSDPTGLFEQYLEENPTQLEFEAEFRTTVIELRNVITSLDYEREKFNISEEWGYPATYIDFVIVGIDELTFNFMQNQTFGKVTNLNLSYQDLESGFAISNFLGEYESLIDELQLAIYTNAIPNSFYDRGEPVYMDLYNDQINRSEVAVNTWITKKDANFSLISSFDIINAPFFYSLVGINLEYSGTPILLCGEALLQQFENYEEEGLLQYRKTALLNLRIDRDFIIRTTSLKIHYQIEYLRGGVPGLSSLPDFKSLNIRSDVLVNLIYYVSKNTRNSQFYALLIYIPIFFFCGIFLTLILSHIIERRREEYQLYLINGMEIHTLKKILLGAGFALGCAGGFFSSFGGGILSRLLENIFYPDISYALFSSGSIIWRIILQNCVIYTLLGGIFVLISLRKPLKLIHLDNMTNNLPNSFTNKSVRSLRKKKWKFIALLIFIAISIFSVVLYYSSIPMDINLILDSDFPFIVQLLTWFGPLMGILPFVFPILLIDLVGDKIGLWITTHKKKSSAQKSKELSSKQNYDTCNENNTQVDDKNKNPQKFMVRTQQTKKKASKIPQNSVIKKLTVWNFSQNLSKNKKLLTIFTFTLILITISSNLMNIYQYSENFRSNLHYAQGEIIQMDVFDDLAFSKIKSVSQKLQNESEKFGVEHFNAIYSTQTHTSEYGTNWECEITSIAAKSLLYYRFSWVNYTLLFQDTTLLDEWFIGGTASEIFNKMELPNSILIPSYFLNQGVNINDTLSFSVKLANGTSINQNGVIIGAYSAFPATSIKGIYMSYDLLQDSCIKFVQFISYSETPMNNSNFQEFQEYLHNNIDAYINIEKSDILRYFNEFDLQVFRLFQWEGYLFIGFSIFGIFLFYLIDNIQSGKEIAILRSKGIRERDLLKSTFWETILLGGCASILSLIAMISSQALFMYLNYVRSGSAFTSDRPLYFQQDWGAFLAFLIIGNSLFLIINMAFAFFKLKSTRSDQKLEFFLRSARQ